MSRYRLVLASVLIFATLLVGLFVLSQKKEEDKSQTLGVSQSPDNYAAITPIPSPGPTLEYDCKKGKSAFAVLETQAELEVEESSLGKMVTGINGVMQNGGKYWLYSIDDKEATVGATTYICKGDEKIKWELK